MYCLASYISRADESITLDTNRQPSDNKILTECPYLVTDHVDVHLDTNITQCPYLVTDRVDVHAVLQLNAGVTVPAPHLDPPKVD